MTQPANRRLVTEAAQTTALAGKANSSDIPTTAAAIGAEPAGAANTAKAAAIAVSAQRASNLSDLASATSARTNLVLGNVTNTSDAAKPVSTAQAAAIALKADKTSLNLANLSDLDMSNVQAGYVIGAADDGSGGFTYGWMRVEDLMANYTPVIFKDSGSPTPTGTEPGTLVGSLSGAAPPSAWGYGGPAGGASGTNVSALTWPVPTAVAVGSKVVIGTGAGASGAVMVNWSATDSKGNTATMVANNIQGSVQQSAQLLLPITTALAAGDTITVTALDPGTGSPSSRSNVNAAAAIILGAASSPVDQIRSGGAGNTLTFSAGPTATTAQADEIAFDAIASYEPHMDSFTPDTGNGWALAGSLRTSSPTGRGLALIYKVLTTAQQVTGSGTITTPGSTSHSSTLVTYKKA